MVSATSLVCCTILTWDRRRLHVGMQAWVIVYMNKEEVLGRFGCEIYIDGRLVLEGQSSCTR